jgi:hypothetical protein
MIKTAQEIGEHDPEHPLGTGSFTNAIKRVKVINDEIKIFELDAPEVTGQYERRGT